MPFPHSFPFPFGAFYEKTALIGEKATKNKSLSFIQQVTLGLFESKKEFERFYRILTSFIGQVASKTYHLVYLRSLKIRYGLKTTKTIRLVFNRALSSLLGLGLDLSTLVQYFRAINISIGINSSIKSLTRYIRSLTSAIGIWRTLEEALDYVRILTSSIGIWAFKFDAKEYMRNISLRVGLSPIISRLVKYFMSLKTSEGLLSILKVITIYKRLVTSIIGLKSFNILRQIILTRAFKNSIGLLSSNIDVISTHIAFIFLHVSMGIKDKRFQQSKFYYIFKPLVAIFSNLGVKWEIELDKITLGLFSKLLSITIYKRVNDFISLGLVSSIPNIRMVFIRLLTSLTGIIAQINKNISLKQTLLSLLGEFSTISTSSRFKQLLTAIEGLMESYDWEAIYTRILKASIGIKISLSRFIIIARDYLSLIGLQSTTATLLSVFIRNTIGLISNLQRTVIYKRVSIVIYSLSSLLNRQLVSYRSFTNRMGLAFRLSFNTFFKRLLTVANGIGAHVHSSGIVTYVTYKIKKLKFLLR